MKRSLALLSCLALLTASPASLAQDSSSPQQSSPSRAAPPRQLAQADLSGPRTFNVVFPGGTIAQYADAVRQVTGGAANIVVNPDAADVTVPALSITGVELQAAMQLLEGRGTAGRTISINEVSSGRSDAQSVFVIESYNRATRRGPMPTQTEVSSVWSLTPIVDSGKNLEDVLSAIETALAMFPEGEPRPQVRLHKETNLLIANGDAAQLKAIGAVLRALNPEMPIDEPRDVESAGASRARAGGGQSDKTASEASVNALRGELGGLRAQVQQLQRQVQALAGKN